MTRIPFIEARFFDPHETQRMIEDRFVSHLRRRRVTDLSAPIPDSDEEDEHAPSLPLTLNDCDRRRISRRAKRLLELREAASGLSHLRRDDRERLEVLRDGARLIQIPSEHRADELAAAVHAEMPWMAPVTEIVWQAMRRSVREGWPGLRVPPLLLDGPPGIGKSHFGRKLGEVLSAPTTIIEATGENASFGVVGSQRGWGSTHPGRLITTILERRIANPVMVVDEIDKASSVTSNKGLAFGLPEGLLPLLEPLTARRWSCPYYQVRFDMSWVIWVLTSNDYRLLPAPLLNRCPPLRLQPLTPHDLIRFAQRQARERGLSEGSTDALIDAIESASLPPHRRSLRLVIRLLDRATDLQNAPIRH
ncbi:AAA family ATPase [Paracoccus sp. PAR01]|uniref:AAA family ATPase n=1 Tax=Paracoccus sp. PAR01 TaxID=2769282 RepID=UPI00177FBBE0|nr:AAA family ATPase [Paracoccus sp. PAR01]MBD9529767.1 AAA family ATPase [Paracoccus sp. PAR01]